MDHSGFARIAVISLLPERQALTQAACAPDPGSAVPQIL